MNEDEIRRHLNRSPVVKPRPMNMPRKMAPRPKTQQDTFKNFSATHLLCPKCKKANPVREKLMLFLPGGNLYDYSCTVCGTSVGSRKG